MISGIISNRLEAAWRKHPRKYIWKGSGMGSGRSPRRTPKALATLDSPGSSVRVHLHEVARRHRWLNQALHMELTVCLTVLDLLACHRGVEMVYDRSFVLGIGGRRPGVWCLQLLIVAGSIGVRSIDVLIVSGPDHLYHLPALHRWLLLGVQLLGHRLSLFCCVGL